MSEYIGYKDPIGNGMFNMGLTDEEIVRCRDCKWFRQHHQLSPFGDYYDYNTCGQIDGITVRAIEPDGYCSWGEKR